MFDGILVDYGNIGNMRNLHQMYRGVFSVTVPDTSFPSFTMALTIPRSWLTTVALPLVSLSTFPIRLSAWSLQRVISSYLVFCSADFLPSVILIVRRSYQRVDRTVNPDLSRGVRAQYDTSLFLSIGNLSGSQHIHKFCESADYRMSKGFIGRTRSNQTGNSTATR